MKLLHWLSTLLFMAIAAATSTREGMLKEIQIMDRWYKLCAENGRLYSSAKILQCIHHSNDNLFSAYARLPHADRGEPPMDSGSCNAVSSALKKPFDAGKILFDILKKPEIICHAKDKATAENVKGGLEITLERWGQKYLPRFHANCKEEKGNVLYAYQEWKAPSEALKGAIGAWELWDTTCASA
ncbi:uncharacterized protein APUU_80965A [Aspergillus puulaauensis]|uniref:Uncharacterized protein n=1 Tax=Aspergillus puulaauensis TaxID=1220207 RepID=A0A7R7Y011_9EURO|nr:uncharacterized protein APUU_80965A [Aspergillus puulaauensis]BCS30662.1 hypothetical protein APUU_80965A [Aspergillus puulaauensis]